MYVERRRYQCRAVAYIGAVRVWLSSRNRGRPRKAGILVPVVRDSSKKYRYHRKAKGLRNGNQRQEICPYLFIVESIGGYVENDVMSRISSRGSKHEIKEKAMLFAAHTFCRRVAP